MEFLIEFSKKQHQVGTSKSKEYIEGFIKIGVFSESFKSTISYWSPEQYIRQWREACARIILENKKTSAIITDMQKPSLKNSLVGWWLMYSSGNTIYIQQHLLFCDKLSVPFDEDNPYKHIPRRSHKRQQKPSEWIISFGDLNTFYLSLRP